MACFLVPAAEALITTVVKAGLDAKKSKDESGEDLHVKVAQTKAEDLEKITDKSSLKVGARTSFSRKLGWLNTMLWGGAALLLIEHIWHGEVVPYFPFLTGMSDPSAIFYELRTTGLTMAAVVTVVWAVAASCATILERVKLKRKVPGENEA